jgi:hypothetical protein
LLGARYTAGVLPRFMLAIMVIATIAGAFLVSCLAAGSGCACGQSYERDPFDPGVGLNIGSDHDESVHCFCRCGDGPRERLAPSETCEGYEGPCQTRDGQLALYVCD